MKNKVRAFSQIFAVLFLFSTTVAISAEEIYRPKGKITLCTAYKTPGDDTTELTSLEDKKFNVNINDCAADSIVELVSFDKQNDRFIIAFLIKAETNLAVNQFTTKGIGRQIALVIDKKTVVISARLYSSFWSSFVYPSLESTSEQLKPYLVKAGPKALVRWEKKDTAWVENELKKGDNPQLAMQYYIGLIGRKRCKTAEKFSKKIAPKKVESFRDTQFLLGNGSCYITNESVKTATAYFKRAKARYQSKNNVYINATEYMVFFEHYHAKNNKDQTERYYQKLINLYNAHQTNPALNQLRLIIEAKYNNPQPKNPTPKKPEKK